MSKKIVIFSGAGLDKESGILTFRDTNDGMWNNYNIDDVATPKGWRKDRAKVLDFYNERRRELPNVEPNEAHKQIARLSEVFEVTNVTQNVSDLLERAGNNNVIHLHGALTQACDSYNRLTLENKSNVYEIGYNDIVIGDKCEVTGSQLRPNIVWFGEYPFRFSEALKVFREADIIIVVGTSLQIGYTFEFFRHINLETEIHYVDPEPSKGLELSFEELNINYIEKSATEGMTELVEELIRKNTITTKDVELLMEGYIIEDFPKEFYNDKNKFSYDINNRYIYLISSVLNVDVDRLNELRGITMVRLFKFNELEGEYCFRGYFKIAGKIYTYTGDFSLTLTDEMTVNTIIEVSNYDNSEDGTLFPELESLKKKYNLPENELKSITR